MFLEKEEKKGHRFRQSMTCSLTAGEHKSQNVNFNVH